MSKTEQNLNKTQFFAQQTRIQGLFEKIEILFFKKRKMQFKPSYYSFYLLDVDASNYKSYLYQMIVDLFRSTLSLESVEMGQVTQRNDMDSHRKSKQLLFLYSLVFISQ